MTRTADRTVPALTPHPIPPNVPMGQWPAQLRLAIERLPTSAYTWDDADPAVVWDGSTSSDPPPAAEDVLVEPFNNATAWTVTGSGTIVAARTGTGLALNGGGVTADYKFTAKKNAYVTVGMAYKTAALTSTNIVFTFRSNSPNEVVTTVQVLTNGALQALWDSGSTLATSAAGVISAGTWCYLEIQIRVHATLGSIVGRINGTTVMSATNVNTMISSTGIDWLQLWCGLGSTVCTFDDLYIAAGSTATFKGDIALGSTTYNYFWDDPQIAGGYTDAVCDLQALELAVGDPDELGLYAAAQATFTLANPTGEYTAWTADGRNTYFAPGRVVALYARHAGVDWWLARLRVDSWTENADGTVTVEASDGFSLLARERAPFTSGFAGQLPGPRIQSIATYARFPDPVRADSGDVTLTAQSTDRPPLEEIQRVALSDGGIVFVDADGALVYRNRLYTAGRTDQTRTDVFSDNVCDSGAKIVWDLELTDADDRLVTDVHLSNVAGLTAVASDTEGWNGVDYFYAHPDPDYWTLQYEGDALAAAILARQGTPRVGIGLFNLWLNDPNQDLWLAGLDRRIGDRVEFLHDFTAPGGIADTMDVLAIVSTIRHEITPEAWMVTIGTGKTVDYRSIERWDRTAYVWDDTDPLADWR